jgi:basic amino acid/polyamine antiporter, APA family
VSTLGSSHVSILTGARVTFAQARDGLLFRFLGRIHSGYETPAVALWVQCGLSCLVVLLLRDFTNLIETFTFTMWIFYGLAAVGLFIVRKRDGVGESVFRVPGYPVVPVVFILASLAMTVLAILDDWKTTSMWLGILLAGVPVYFVWRGLTNPRSTSVD